MYIFFNANPSASRVGDCTIRAIATATQQNWEAVYIAVCIYGLALHDMPSANRVWGDYLESLGWKREMIEERGYSVADFARDHKKGAYILAISGHVVACVDGNYIDTWDSGQEIPVYYWRKAE